MGPQEQSGRRGGSAWGSGWQGWRGGWEGWRFPGSNPSSGEDAPDEPDGSDEPDGPDEPGEPGEPPARTAPSLPGLAGMSPMAGMAGMSPMPGMAGMPPMPGMPSMPGMQGLAGFPGQEQLLVKLVSVVTSRFKGRRLTVHTKLGDVTLTLTDLEVPAEQTRLSSGQLGEVTVAAQDVRWRELICEQVTGTLRNTQLRSGGERLRLVAAPADLVVTMTSAVLDQLVAPRVPALRVEVTDHAVPMATWRRHPEWGSVEVDVGVDGGRVWVKPRQLLRGAWHTGVVRRIPEFSFRLPLPPDRVHLVGVAPRPGALDVGVQVSEWQIPLPTAGIDEAVRRVAKLGSAFDVTGWSW